LHSGLDALSPFSFLAIAALIGLVILPASRRRALYLALAASLWAAYVVVIGGDIFPAYRHFVPLIVIFAFAIVEFLRAVGELLGKHRWVASVAAVFLLIQLVPFARLQAEDKQSRRAVAERWEWQCRDLGVLLRRAFTERQPTVAVTAAGCLPYWSELPALDMLGLNDYYLPRHRPSDFGTGFLGHELGDGAYVLRAAPDMIVFTVGSDPAFRSGTQLAQSPEFHERYVPVPIRVPSLDPFPIVYFDRDSPRIGVRRVASSLVVPGFLFRSPHAVARLNEDGTLVVSVTRDEPVRAVLPSAVDPASQTAVVGPHPALVNVELEADARTVVLTTSASEPVDVESVTFTPPASGGTGAETATR
jgi:hypothetical protein